MSEQAKGSMTVREAARRAGEKRRAQNPDWHAMGKLGGEATRDRYGPEFYQELGKAGGAANVAKYDLAHFQRIGKAGGQKVKDLIAAGRRAEENGNS